MSTQTQAQTNGLVTGSENYGVQKDAITRIHNIPLVQETVAQILSIVNSNCYSAYVYEKGESIAIAIYGRTKPIVQPGLETADVYANKALDMVEHRYPGAFKANTSEIVANARKPADAAIEIFHTRLQAAQASLVSVQDRLAGTIAPAVAKIPKNTDEANKAMSELLAELGKIKDQTASNIKDLPEKVQGVVHPLVDSLNNGIHDINAELYKHDVPINQRAMSVLKYSRENALPVIQQTLENLKGLVIKKKEEVEANVQQ